MSRQRNWTAVGLGVEVLAGVAILISPWLAIPIALGGAGIIAWGLYPEKIERVISKVLPGQIANQDADPYIPLKEAATIAYEETRGTMVATIAEGPNPDDILGYYAHALFNGKTTLYGNHPPSRKLEAVPNEEYGRCGFSDDQNALRRHGENRNLYENLQIKRSDLLRRITELKGLSATVSREKRARKISKIYGDAVALRNHIFLLRVVDRASGDRMNDLQYLLIDEIRELAPERTINLETINTYNELDHPLCNLQDRTRAMVFSEVLLRVKKILEDYK